MVINSKYKAPDKELQGHVQWSSLVEQSVFLYRNVTFIIS